MASFFNNSVKSQLQSSENTSSCSFSSMTVPRIENIFATVNLNCKLDLKHIVLHARNAEYNPRKVSAVIMRIRDPKSTARIYESGKMVCFGVKTEEHSRIAARKFTRILQKLGFEAKFQEFKIQNIVGSYDAQFSIRLAALAIGNEFCSYEPELLPAVVYRMTQPNLKVLIFDSGRIIFNGAKYRSELQDALQNIYPLLKNYRVNFTTNL